MRILFPLLLAPFVVQVASSAAVPDARIPILPMGDSRHPLLPPAPAHLAHRHGDDEDQHDVGHSHNMDAPQQPPAPSATGADLILEPLPSTHAHSHHHGASAAQSTLNETDILLTHQPNPLSYWTHDYVLGPDDDRLGGRGQYGGWILWGHAIGMSVAMVLLVPLAHALRSTPLATPIVLVAALLTLIGLLSSAVYTARTPDLYAHNSHGPVGWALVSLFFAVGVWDVGRAVRNVNGGGWKAKCWRLLGVETNGTSGEAGYARVGAEADAGLETISEHDDEGETSWKLEREEEEVVVLFSPSSPEGQRRHLVAGRTDTTHHASLLEQDLSPRSSSSTLRHQQDTSRSALTEHGAYDGSSKPVQETAVRHCLRLCLTLAWVLVPVFGVAAFLSGITVYAGSCRAEYISGCLAHLIKGSIFFFYGMATFARYLGAFAEFGWAWNVRPAAYRQASDAVKVTGKGMTGGENKRLRWQVSTAEAVESWIIFVYGLTNTWMERFGAEPGSPYTIHQVQHISIALMFFGGGLMGIALEAPTARNLLSTSLVQLDGRRLSKIEKPPTWSGSFNPFPALVIGLTGLVMGSHHQKYVFAVQIHALWGNFLALFGVFRIATYVFLWLRPPRSVLPSRPPTEAIAAFCVTCGGISFMLSNEQVVYGAMRSGWDDAMSFLTLTVSSTYLLFGWLFLVLVARGWAKRRAPTCQRRDSWSSSSEGSSSSSPLHGVGGRV